jgi:catechol 2,3-dioxygenase-like lactoylglutathione lyase family enzyme
MPGSVVPMTGTLRGLATISFFTDDMEAATRWYADLLGIEPYFEVPGPDGKPAYREFRIGDDSDELGLIDRRFAPGNSGSGEPGGAVAFWHVDDVEAMLARLLSMGATEYEALTRRAEGFVTASVVDPFGNVLGIMYNPHWLEIREARIRRTQGTA